ncbi:hypothetical protein M5K25_022227 [Dendrobium thyrsiflorum]|uniref:Uncharacterized protein n=1 Tax=Dendrobium thyrsiflorum TaxID=117978 RepID=A0ABD0U6B4_DENTH
MHRQMKAKDKEIAQLNAKMTEMMTQMTMMMQMMQRNITANPIPVQQTNHQATSSGLANPPVHPVPQVSGVRGSHEGGIENDRLIRQPTPQNVASTSEPVTVAQLETIINEKIKALEGVPGVKWKSPTEPVLDLKALPIAQTSTFKQRPNQAGSSKSGKEKSPKRKTKLKKFKEKRTATQRAIDCLDEYYQTVRRPIKLADFMSELKVAEAEEADEEPFPVETCRVISVTPVAPIKDKYVNELVVEICLATSSMDYSSEEDLYFPREVESEHDITSQMEHVQLEGDSELEGESLDAMMADSGEDAPSNDSEPDEIAQKSSSSLEAKASSSKAAKRPVQEGEKKQVWRKKATPTLPKTVVISKERKNVPHLGSDTEEEDVTSTKSQKVCQSTAKKKKKVEYSDSDYDYESTYASTVQCVFSRRIGNLSISDNVFVVTRIPMQHFKEITPREVTGMHSFIKPAKAESKGQKVSKFSDKSMKTNQKFLEIRSVNYLQQTWSASGAHHICWGAFVDPDTSVKAVPTAQGEVRREDGSKSRKKSPDARRSKTKIAETTSVCETDSANASGAAETARIDTHIGWGRRSAKILFSCAQIDATATTTMTANDDSTMPRHRICNTCTSRQKASTSSQIERRNSNDICPHILSKLNISKMPPHMHRSTQKGQVQPNTRMGPGERIMGIYVTSRDAARTNIHPKSIRYPWTTQPMAADKDPSVRMDLRNTPFTVQLGRGASIQLANATINTGNSGATIQFGELQFSLATASAAAVPVYGMDTEGPAGRPYAADVAARHVHPPPRRPQPAEVITANEFPQRRVSVFKRLSNSETPTTRRVVAGKQISVLPTATTTLPTGFSMPGRNDAEASSSGGRPSRRQRRRMNAELRAQQLLQVHPSTLPAQEPEASVPTQNKFTNLKWVKRNSSTGELKQSFWEQRPQAPVPQKKKEPETLSGRVHRVLKTVKERGLMKKKYQRPLVIEARRIPPRELPPLVTRGKFKPNLQEAHRGVTLGPRVQESAAERAQQKDKQVWRPRPHEKKALGRQTNMGVTSGAASQKSAPPTKVIKSGSQRRSHLTTLLMVDTLENSPENPIISQLRHPKKKLASIVAHESKSDEPEIQWKRRSGIRTREDDENDEETMRVEVVYMVEHDDEPPLLRVYRRQHGAGSTAGRDEDSSENEEEEEFEENPLFADAATLAEAQRQMHRQMKAKDKEIAQLNAKMTEMMTQMTMMMQMMQRNITANPIPVQQTNHQATSSGLANPPVHPVPQVSGVRGSHEGGIENDRLIRQPTPQNVASTSEPVTVAQLETIINEKIKALEGVPGVKWKSPTEPVLDLKALPIAQTSTFKQRPNQAGSSKSGKEKSPKRKTKLKKFKEKRTATQRAIDCLDEYYQTVRRPIKLADFMSELKVAEAEEADEEPFPVETCRVISVTPVAPIKDKYVNELVVEICLATSSMDYSSEEDLYFPREVESEHDITSQMEHVQLEGDSELEGESLDAMMADSGEDAPSNDSEPDEIAQVQLRSGKRLLSPPKKGVSNKDKGKEIVWRKKATPTLPKTVVISKERKNVPHLGSDTEEEDVTSTKSQKVCQSTAKKKKKVEYSDSDYDYESTYASTVQCVFSRRIGNLSISDNVFVVTRIPMQHFKEITPREVYNVEELITFYVPPHRKRGGPGSLFYKAGEREEETNCDWFHRLIDSGELIPTRMPTLSKHKTKDRRNYPKVHIKLKAESKRILSSMSLLRTKLWTDDFSPST